MRNLTWIALVAFAVACNKDGDETGDTDTSDSDTQPDITYALESGTATYEVKVDGTAVCASSYSLTGEEVEAACPDCDFVFSVESTETANTDTAGCNDRNPWRYTLSVPYPAYYPDDRAGLGYVDGAWYAAGYGAEFPVEKLFFSFYHYEGTVYGYGFLAGKIYPGEANEIAMPGTFTNTDGAIAWTFDPAASKSPSAAFIRNCSDSKALGKTLADGNYLGEVATIAASAAGNAIVGGDTVNTYAGTVGCDAGKFADSWTMTVAAAGPVKATLDTPNSSNPMDAYLFINDSNGCTVAVADDQFNCTAGKCTGGDADATNDYDCCSSVTFTAAVGTYTVYSMAHPTGGGSCTATDKMGNYELKLVGATAVAAGDELSPDYEVNASGTGTVVEE